MSNQGRSNQSSALARVLPFANEQKRLTVLFIAGLITLITMSLLWVSPSYGTGTTGDMDTKSNPAGLPDSLPDMNEFIPVDTQPELIYRHPPKYPRIAENAGITGQVYLKALINESGEVLKTALLKSSGNVWLDRAAGKAAAKNKYKPAIFKGKPIKYWATYKVDFTLGE